MFGMRPIRTLPTTALGKRRYEKSLTDNVTPIPDGKPFLSEPKTHPAASIFVQHTSIKLLNDSDEILYVKKGTPASAVETLDAAWKQCGSQGRKLYTALAMDYIERAAQQPRETITYNGSMRFGPNMTKYWYDFHAQFITFNNEDIAERITLEWSRRCCGVILDSGIMSGKLLKPVRDEFVKAARPDLLTAGGRLMRQADDRLPEPVVSYMCTVMNEYILTRYPKALTWYHPDEELAFDALWYHEVVNQGLANIAYISDLRSEDGEIINWLWESEHYPLEPGDRSKIRPFHQTREEQTPPLNPPAHMLAEMKIQYDEMVAYMERCKQPYPRAPIEVEVQNGPQQGEQGGNAH